MRAITEFSLVREAADFLQHKIQVQPRVGIILGTGLGACMDQWKIDFETPFHKIPHFNPSAVISHRGKVCVAAIGNVPVIIFSGRIHYYEGHDMDDVVRSVRVMKQLGCTHLVISNASGALNPAFNRGDIVLIKDHINVAQVNPLRGPHDERWGPRFPELRGAYDAHWLEQLKNKISTQNISVKEGVYAWVAGPSLETESECEYLYRIGADMVGMSTVPEVIVARQMGMKVLGISVIANVNYPKERAERITVEEIVKTVEERSKDVSAVIESAVLV